MEKNVIRLALAVFLFVISFYLSGYTFPAELEKGLSNMLKYTPAQVTVIKTLYDDAVKNELPEKALNLRIMEATAKKVPYAAFAKVFTSKIEKLNSAKQIIGRKSNDRAYHIQLLAELMDRGMTDDEFNEFSAIADIANKKFDDVLVYAQTYVLLLENEVNRPLAKEVVIRGMKLRLMEVKLIPQLFIKAKEKNIPQKNVREIFITGVDKKKGYLWIHRTLFGIEPEETRQEIKEEIIIDHEREKKR